MRGSENVTKCYVRGWGDVLVYFVTLFSTKSINIWHGFLNVTQKGVETLNISKRYGMVGWTKPPDIGVT